MATVYPVLYRLGLTPWEANRDDRPLAQLLATRPPGRPWAPGAAAAATLSLSPSTGGG